MISSAEDLTDLELKILYMLEKYEHQKGFIVTFNHIHGYLNFCNTDDLLIALQKLRDAQYINIGEGNQAYYYIWPEGRKAMIKYVELKEKEEKEQSLLTRFKKNVSPIVIGVVTGVITALVVGFISTKTGIPFQAVRFL
ncbi:hypothetical protein [Anaerotruncus rubiinfantis]|uniref:hypothetical protein n=1 Tax=Anaerotruncus rubiinfantis TaxID=1720200 RepID=UPI003D79AD6B